MGKADRSVARSEPDEVIPGLLHYGVSESGTWIGDDALCVLDGGEVVLIDPLPIDLASCGMAAGTRRVVVTTPGHLRAARALAARAAAPILAPSGSLEPGRPGDRPRYEWYSDGTLLPGGIVAVAAPGPARHHHLLHIPLGPGAVYCPDLLINHPTQGLRFVPEEYQVDPLMTRGSARRLLDLPFDVLCFGHGAPIRAGAKAALREFLRANGTIR